MSSTFTPIQSAPSFQSLRHGDSPLHPLPTSELSDPAGHPLPPQEEPPEEPTGESGEPAEVALAAELDGLRERMAERDARVGELEEALSRQQEEGSALAAAAVDAADALDQVRTELVGDLRREAAEVIVAACSRIVGLSSEAGDQVFEGRLSAVFEQLVLEPEVTLHVHPSRGALARELLGARRGWEVVEDPALDDGCRAHCRTCVVDGSVEASMRAIQRAVHDWLRGDGGGAP